MLISRRCIITCLLAISLLSGCAHVERPSREMRAGFGAIAVVSPSTPVKGDFGAPTSGKLAGAAKAANIGALATIGGGAASGYVIGLALGIVLSPAIALGSGVYGAVVTESRAKVKEEEDSIGSALKDIDIQQAMLDRVFKAARERTPCNLVPVFAPVKEDPASPSGGVSYHDLKEFGVDTALAASVTSYRLDTTGGQGLAMDPPLSVCLEVRVRLIRCLDGKELYANSFTYKGKGLQSKYYREWAANRAKPLRDEIDRALDALSQQIVEEVLLGVPYSGGPERPYSRPSRYAPGYEPERGWGLRDLFEPSDKHTLE